MNTTPDRDRLDDLLNSSSPRTTVTTSAVERELTRLRSAAEREARTVGARTVPAKARWLRPVMAGAASVVLLGGAATAAAAVTGVWSPWAATPDEAISYVLPSGAQCEHRLGDVTGSDPAAVAVVEEFYRDTDVQALLSDDAIDDTITQLRSEDNSFVNEDGSLTPAGFGTDSYSADQEYSSAVSRIISSAVSEKLAEHGIDGSKSDLSYAGEAHCPGADW